jgi:aspartate/methionine/tyrosine aminotransferase
MNPRVTAIAPSLIRDLNGRKRPTSIDLGLGEPILKPDPGPLRNALAWVEAHGCPYSPNAGLQELRVAVARYHDYPGLNDPSQVGITVGSQEALAVAIVALADPMKDEAIVINPSYPAYTKLCDLFGVRTKIVDLDPADLFTPRAAPVLAALTPQTRLVIIGSPANPTGRAWPASELQRLAEGLKARGGPPIYIISDEVYRELYYGVEPPASPAAFHSHTVVVGSISKPCALTGLRIGWFIGPNETSANLQKTHQFFVSSTNTIGQRAAIEIFARPELMAAHRPRYVERRAVVLEELDAAGLVYVPPDGAFYVFVKLRGAYANDSLKFALTLLEQKDVVVIPGAAFDVEGWARLSFVGEPAMLREGVARMAAFADGK